MPGIDFKIGGSTAPLEKSLASVERTTKIWAQRMDRNIAMGLGQWMATGNAPNPLGKSFQEATKHAGGLNTVLRESLVVLREMGRGNWSRIPGSISLIVQGLAQMKQISMLTLGLWGAGAAIAFGAVYEQIWGIKNLLKSLSMDLSKIDLKADYVPMLKRHIEDARNMQRQLNAEILKTVDNYQGAAAAAKRMADSTKEHFEHLRKMNEYSTGSPQQKAQRALDLDQQEREADLASKRHEQFLLEIEAGKKLAQARGIKVNTKEEDEDIASQKKQLADAAAGFLVGGGVWEEVKKRWAMVNMTANGLDGRKIIEQLEEGGRDTAQALIQNSHTFADQVAANDELRKQKADLEKAGSEAFSKATEIRLGLPGLQNSYAQKNADEAAETRAQLMAGGRGGSSGVTANERIGAYAVGLQGLTLVEVARRQVARQETTNQLLSRIEQAMSKNPLSIRGAIMDAIDGRFGDGPVGGVTFNKVYPWYIFRLGLVS